MTTGHDDRDPFASWEASLQNETAAVQQEPAALDAPAEAPDGPQELPTAEGQGEGAPAQIDSLAAVFIQSESAPPALPEDQDLAAARAQNNDEAAADAATKAAAIAAFYRLRAAQAALDAAAAAIAGHGYTTTATEDQLPALLAALDNPASDERREQLRHAVALLQLQIARREAAPHSEVIEVLQAADELPPSEA